MKYNSWKIYIFFPSEFHSVSEEKSALSPCEQYVLPGVQVSQGFTSLVPLFGWLLSLGSMVPPPLLLHSFVPLKVLWCGEGVRACCSQPLSPGAGEGGKSQALPSDAGKSS